MEKELCKKKAVKILIVDDNESVVTFLESALEVLSLNIITDTAEDGYTACVKAVNQVPDIILLDIQMPDMNGIEVCRGIRGNPDTKHAKIIIMTGYATDAHLAGLKEFKIEKILLKPFGMKALAETLRPLLCPVEAWKDPHALSNPRVG